MTDILEFIQRHPWLIGALVAVTVLTVWTELQRFTQKFANLSPAQLVQVMNSESPLLLDVREANEVQGGLIGNARHIPLGDLGKRIGELDKSLNKKVVAYCRSGNRSTTACRLLEKHNFTDVAHLQGGIMAWESANLPLKGK